MTPKTPKPSRLAYDRYEQEEKLAVEHYLQFWKDLFVSYGFVIVPSLYGHYEFGMTFNGITANVFCYPSRFQGIKISCLQIPFNGVVTKAISETGAIKWMKENGLGIPH